MVVLLLIEFDVVQGGRLVVLDQEELTVASEDDVHLALHHVDTDPDVDVHELGLDGEEGNPAGEDGSVEGAEVRPEGEGGVVAQTVVAVDHHGPVAVVAPPGVPEEVLLAPGALLPPTLVRRALGVEVGLGVVPALAVLATLWTAGLGVTVTEALLTGLGELTGGPECSRETLVTPPASGSVLTVLTDVRGEEGETGVSVTVTELTAGDTVPTVPHEALPAGLAGVPRGVVLTVVTEPDPLETRAEIVTAAVLLTGGASPAQLTEAGEVFE